MSRTANKKLVFLKAFARVGSISGAARAVRISRDAVHDWINRDESFARQFDHAKCRRKEDPFQSLNSSLIFITDVIRPHISRDAWPRVASAIAIAMANLKNDLKGGRRRALARTGEVAEMSLSRYGFEGVAIPNRGQDSSANDL